MTCRPKPRLELTLATVAWNWLFIDGALRKSGHLKYYELIKSILTIVKKAENSLL